MRECFLASLPLFALISLTSCGLIGLPMFDGPGSAKTIVHTGTVLDAKGLPVEAADVYLAARSNHSVNVDILQCKSTDKDGKFCFSPVARPLPGAFSGGHILLVAKPGVAWGGRDMLPHDPRTGTEPLTVSLEKATAFLGQVVDCEGNGIVGARVYPSTNMMLGVGYSVVRILPGMEEFAATTDADGRFTFDQIPTGKTVGLLVQHNDYATRRIRADERFGGFPVGQEVCVEMAPPARIEGRLTDGETGKPVGGVLLKIQGRGGPGISFAGAAVTDDDGGFLHGNLPAMTYSITSVSGGKQERGLASPIGGLVLEEGGELTGIQLVWGRGCRVAGRVVNSKTGGGIAEATVGASRKPTDPKGTWWRGDLQTDSDGRFELRTPPGKITLSAFAPGSPAFIYVFTKQEITVGASTPVEDFELQLEPNPNIRMEVRVVDIEAQPVEGAVLRVPFERGKPEHHTDAKGRYVFKSLWMPAKTRSAHHDMALYVGKPEDNLFGRLAIDPAAEGCIVTSITLLAGGAVTGRIVNRENRPISGATAQITRQINKGGGRSFGIIGPKSVTGEDGRFRVGGLMDGTPYRLSCRASGYSSWSAHRIEAQAGKIIDKGDIRLAWAEQHVEGVVADPWGRPIPKARIYCFGSKQPANIEVKADKDGKFRLAPLVEGELTLNFSAEGFRPGNRNLKIGKDNLKPITLELEWRPGSEPKPTVGATAPALSGVEWLTGDGDLEGLRGEPVALLFFSSTSRPSRAALSRLKAVRKELGKDAFSVVAVHDASISAEAVQASVAKEQLPFVVGRVTDEAKQGWLSPSFLAYGVRSLPHTVLLDAQGRIARHCVPISHIQKAVRDAVQ